MQSLAREARESATRGDRGRLCAVCRPSTGAGHRPDAHRVRADESPL